MFSKPKYGANMRAAMQAGSSLSPGTVDAAHNSDPLYDGHAPVGLTVDLVMVCSSYQ